MNIFDNSMNFTSEFSLVLAFLTFIIGVVVSYKSHPIIIKISNIKNLMSEPNHRDVHSKKTPNLGGIALFLATSLVILFLSNFFDVFIILNLLGSIMIIFFIGLVDDLIGMRPKSKLIGQITVIISIILFTNLRIECLYGLLGFYELPYAVSILITVLFFVTIINAYNLIDGVDGLAGSFAITVNVFFGCFFYLNTNYFMCYLSFGMVGALISFLLFNFSKKDKIFMGDTGSLVIGFILAYQAINLLPLSFTENGELMDSKSIIYILALFSFPLIDTTRVFIIRLRAGKNPFTADNNHIHHNLLAFGLRPWKISILTTIITIFMVLLVFLFDELEINLLTVIYISACSIIAIIINNLQRFKKK